jgi:hypothetical protein
MNCTQGLEVMVTLGHNGRCMQELSIHHYCSNTTPCLAQDL